MRSARHFSEAFLLLLITLFAVNASAATAADDEQDEYDESARVLRVSLLRGEVSLRRAGSQDWESAQLNLPLVEGDTLATGRESRLEIQIDSRNFLRVSEDSLLRIVTLRDEGIALSLAEGKATLRLARFEHDREYFEIDAPKTTLAAEKRGLYRLEVSREGNVRLTVRDGGQARIYSETNGFTLRDGRTAELTYDQSNDGDWQLAKLSSRDEWDDWVDQRERELAERLRYEQRDRYYDDTVWSAEELDAYGDWAYANDYGWVWRPSVTVINHYGDWAPYRYGRWTWCPPYGWTWVGDEPWGWAPYHYGRWVYYNNNWCWAPRGYGYHYKRAYWRPALVAFVYLPTSYGEQVAWYPLTYGQRDPHSRSYRQGRPERLSPLRSNEVSALERTNPAALRAVTTVPLSRFGARDTRLQPAPTDLARRALNGEPVRGRLPIGPANAASRNGGATGPGIERPTRATGAARPASIVPAAERPERPTGAATRRPGAPLDNELRRTRIYNGREPRDISGVNERNTGGNGAGGAQDARERDTGAVARPARPVAARPVERVGGQVDESETGDNQSPARPVRPGRTGSRVERPPQTNEDAGREPEELRGRRERRPPPERRTQPVVTPQREQPSTNAPQRPEASNEHSRPAEERPDESQRHERPSRREPVDRPVPPERPAPVEHRAPVERQEPRERHDRQERQERQERDERPSHSEPQQRSEPAQRREQPAQRSEPAPSRSEPRSEPAPQRAPQPEPSRAPEPPRERAAPARERERSDDPVRPPRAGRNRGEP